MTGCVNDQNATGNRIVINHSDGSATFYMHLAPKQNGLPWGVVVITDNQVIQGALIGRSGNTGYVQPCNPDGTGGYHLHFNRQNQGGTPWTTSQPVYFEEYPGQQLATYGTFTSRNYDHAVLVQDAPLPDAYSSPILHVRPQDNGANLLSFDNQTSAVHDPEGVTVRLFAEPNYAGAWEDFPS